MSHQYVATKLPTGAPARAPLSELRPYQRAVANQAETETPATLDDCQFGRVVLDPKHLEMWRVRWPHGRLSNLSRAKDALSRFMESEERRERSWPEEPIRKPPVRLNSGGGR